MWIWGDPCIFKGTKGNYRKNISLQNKKSQTYALKILKYKWSQTVDSCVFVAQAEDVCKERLLQAKMIASKDVCKQRYGCKQQFIRVWKASWQVVSNCLNRNIIFNYLTDHRRTILARTLCCVPFAVLLLIHQPLYFYCGSLFCRSIFTSFFTWVVLQYRWLQGPCKVFCE